MPQHFRISIQQGEDSILYPLMMLCIYRISFLLSPWYVFDISNKNLFAHEIAHTLGMDLHDDDFYTENPGDRLLMWSDVGQHSNIWSPEAKRRINQHDTSCLPPL